MNRTQLAELARKYLQGTASEEEKALLHAWYDAAGDNAIEEVQLERPDTEDGLKSRILQQIEREITAEGHRRRTRYRTAAAAAVLLMAIAGYWLLRHQGNDKPHGSGQPEIAQATPGGRNTASQLVLADGSRIDLDSTGNGNLGTQGSSSITQQQGMLVYRTDEQASNGAPAPLNKLIVPRGGKYRITLPDGSVVWLNSASTLTFPASFAKDKRNVQLSGEAYFEIKQNAQAPFSVTANGVQVHVLGTSFNIAAYEDAGDISATLLEGSVRVTAGTADRLLQKGQQARVSKSNGNMEVAPADTAMVLAWKNDVFLFRDNGIRDVMQQLARWYDLEVVYDDDVSALQFTGEISRTEDLAAVLRKLSLTGAVGFNARGSTVHVFRK